MAGILDFYGYDSGTNDMVSQKQQLANIDNAQDEKIKKNISYCNVNNHSLR